MIHRLTAASFTALLLAACGDPDAPADLEGAGAPESRTAHEAGGAEALPGAAPLTVAGGWVRNPVGGRAVTAGYFTLPGNGAPARLVAAQSREAERIELHTMAMDGDVMRMRQVEGMNVPANGALSLQAGGDHLMIFGLAPDAAEDGVLDVVLELEDGRTVDAQLPFADSAPDAGAADQN